MRFNNRFLLSSALILALLVTIACSQQKTEHITIVGVETIAPAMDSMIDGFRERNSNVIVNLTKEPNTIGIEKFVNGNADIAHMSRRITEEERAIAEENGFRPVELVIANNRMAVIVNVVNPVRALSMEQLKGIYNGSITNWAEVGGENSTIIAYSAMEATGNHYFFIQKVLGTLTHNHSIAIETSNIEKGVTNNIEGIGYITTAQILNSKSYNFKKIKTVSIMVDGKGLSPMDNAVIKQYPLTRQLYIYIRNDSTDAVRALVNYELSETGQMILSEHGILPIDNEQLAQDKVILQENWEE